MTPEIGPNSALAQAMFKINGGEYKPKNPISFKCPDTPFAFQRAFLRAAVIAGLGVERIGEDEQTVIVDSPMTLEQWKVLQGKVANSTVGLIAKSLSAAYTGNGREEFCWIFEIAMDHRDNPAIYEFATSASLRLLEDDGLNNEGEIDRRSLTYEGYVAALAGELRRIVDAREAGSEIA